MRKFVVLLWMLAFLCTGCVSDMREQQDAEARLSDILNHFSICDGVIYSDRNGAPYPLSDAMKERLFFAERELAFFAYVESTAMYVSRRFSAQEILVLKLCDRSHRDEAMRLCRVRAAKKKNAVVLADGVYVYLICTDQNEKIVAYLH